MMIEPRQTELSVEDRERIRCLFNRLDINKDVRVDIKDLTEGLQQLRIPTVPGQAQVDISSRLF